MDKRTYTIINSIALIVMILWVQFVFLHKNTSENEKIYAVEEHSFADPLSSHTIAWASPQYASSDTQSDDTVVDKLVEELSQENTDKVIQIVENGNYDIDVLKAVYEAKNNDEILTLMIKEYSNDFQFDEAYAYLEQNKQLIPHLVSWDDYLFIYANSSNLDIKQPSSIAWLQKIVAALAGANKISASTQALYNGLIDFRNGNVDDMYKEFNGVTDPQKKWLLQAMAQDMQYVKSQKYAPSYYTKALHALTLLQYRYVSIAQKVALDVLYEDDNYILPYQILAYSHFLRKERKKSASYTRDLLARDTEQRSMYQFLLGVIAYREWKYQEAILYFVGVDESYLRSDMYRYLMLSYHALGDEKSAVANMENLLGEKMEPSDYYSYFLMAYFEPMRYGQSYSLIESNPDLATKVLQHCYESIGTAHTSVCDLGYVGKLLYEGNPADAVKKLLVLAKKYPQGFIFEALWDYYLQQGEKAKAVKYYIQALRLTTDVQERFHTKNKILALTEPN